LWGSDRVWLKTENAQRLFQYSKKIKIFKKLELK